MYEESVRLNSKTFISTDCYFFNIREAVTLGNSQSGKEILGLGYSLIRVTIEAGGDDDGGIVIR